MGKTSFLQGICLGRLSRQVLSRYLEHSRPHPLLAAQFDAKFDPDELQLSELVETGSISLSTAAGQTSAVSSLMLDTLDNEDGENEEHDFQLPRREFKALFRHARNVLQAFLNELKHLRSYGNKVLIVDRESNLLLNKLVHWFELKRVGVACVFVLGEHQISNLLTKACDVVYLLCMASLDEKEFHNLMEELKGRQCARLHLYLSGVCDLHDPIERQQLEVFARLGQQQPRLCKTLGACSAYTERLALVDNAVENVRFVLHFARRPCDRSLLANAEDPINVHMRTLAHKLANLLLDTCGLFPHVRYFDSFHGLSKWMAKLTFDRINEKRRTNVEVSRSVVF